MDTVDSTILCWQKFYFKDGVHAQMIKIFTTFSSVIPYIVSKQILTILVKKLGARLDRQLNGLYQGAKFKLINFRGMILTDAKTTRS